MLFAIAIGIDIVDAGFLSLDARSNQDGRPFLIYMRMSLLETLLAVAIHTIVHIGLEASA